MTVYLSDDLAGADLVQNGYDSLVEMMISEDVGHICAEVGIALKKTGRNVSHDNDISTVGGSCNMGLESQFGILSSIILSYL